jgi:hypothetical protein
MLLLCGLAAAQTTTTSATPTTTTVKKPAVKTPPTVVTKIGGYAPPGESAYPINQVPAKPKVGPAPAPAPSVPACPRTGALGVPYNLALAAMKPVQTFTQSGSMAVLPPGSAAVGFVNTNGVVADMSYQLSGKYISAAQYSNLPNNYTAIVNWSLTIKIGKGPHPRSTVIQFPMEVYPSSQKGSMNTTSTLQALTSVVPGTGTFQFTMQIYACHL